VKISLPDTVSRKPATEGLPRLRILVKFWINISEDGNVTMKHPVFG
jgi:hypothetical protein